MADGDISRGTVASVTNGDTIKVTWTTGPRIGETWSVRDTACDAFETTGDNRYLGQAAKQAAAAWLPTPPGLVEVYERGEDQYGRIVGLILRVSDFASLGDHLIAEGLATTLIYLGEVPTGFNQYSRPSSLVGTGDPANILADVSLP